MPTEESLPIPLKFTDATRTTHTNLDVLQESRIDDCWSVDVDRNLSDSWTGFTKITPLTEKPSKKDFCGTGGGLQKFKQLPDLMNYGLKFGPACHKAAQRREKQQWAKPNLDNARRMRDICFIDPEDEEHQETIKNSSKKLEVLMEAAMLCEMETRKRARKLRETVPNENTNSRKKTNYACTAEAHESTRKRLESALPRNHQDHIAGNGLIH